MLRDVKMLYFLTGVIDLPWRVLPDGTAVRSFDSLGVLKADSAFVALTIVFGVVVELESDSFSKLPISSLS